MITAAHPGQELARTERVRAWLETPGLPLRVGEPCGLVFQFDHPGLAASGLGDMAVTAECVASSEGVQLAPIDDQVSVRRHHRHHPVWVAQMSGEVGRDPGSIQLRLRVTPRIAGSPRIVLIITLRPGEPPAGLGEVYHRVDLEIPSVP
jgi:hypothetical protein